ncbi:MAG: LuxR family transcriptional regulator [Caulobacteraceae bacterium]|nr:MAG: LuxR family transcriptional regulator [Caulobacteraceae bacterium]
MAADLDSVLDRCLEAAAAPELWPGALAALAAAMGSRGVLLTRPARNHFGILYPSSMEDAIGLFFEEEWHLRDLRSERAVARGEGKITADQHVISPDEVSRSDYYNGFAKRADVPWFSAFGILAAGNAFVGMSFQRRQSEGAFSNSDLATISRAAPRLRQAMNLSANVTNVRDAGRLDGLALVDQAALLLADSGEVLAGNAMAEVLLAIGTGLRRGGRGLVAAHPASRPRLERYLAAACGDGPEAARMAAMPLALACTDGLVLMLQATPVIGEANAVFGAGKTLLMITTVGDSRAPSAERLKEAFGLTATEARVAAVVASGRPVKQVADMLGMSDSAVRFHIKSILPKALVRTTAQFVAAAGKLA